jgi:hypothetical protein
MRTYFQGLAGKIARRGTDFASSDAAYSSTSIAQIVMTACFCQTIMTPWHDTMHHLTMLRCLYDAILCAVMTSVRFVRQTSANSHEHTLGAGLAMLVAFKSMDSMLMWV